MVIAAGDPALRGVLAGWLEVWGLKARKAGSAEGLAEALADGEAALLVASSSIIAAAPSRSAPVPEWLVRPCGRTAGARQRPRRAARILALRTAR